MHLDEVKHILHLWNRYLLEPKTWISQNHSSNRPPVPLVARSVVVFAVQKVGLPDRELLRQPHRCERARNWRHSPDRDRWCSPAIYVLKFHTFLHVPDGMITIRPLLAMAQSSTLIAYMMVLDQLTGLASKGRINTLHIIIITSSPQFQAHHCTESGAF